MKAGETIRIDCADCSAEWEITLEPKAKGSPKAAAEMEAILVEHCPGCGGTNIEVT